MSEKTTSPARNDIVWIARTAIFIALLVAAQWATRPLGQFVTGSAVNLILAVSVMTVGLSSGMIVAAISPMMAAMLGIAPNFVFAPFIAAGNIAFVILWYFIGNINKDNKYVAWIIAMITAAAVKFLVLYLGVARYAIPVIIDPPNPDAAANMIRMFSIPQFVTALIGGALAILILPVLKKAIR